MAIEQNTNQNGMVAGSAGVGGVSNEKGKHGGLLLRETDQHVDADVPSAIMPTDKMSVATVSGSHDITQQIDMNLVPLTVVMDKIRKGSYRISIEKIREFAAKGDLISAAKWKKNLPYFVYGVIKGSRKAENVVQANGIVFDFDHVKDIEAFKKLAAEKIPGAKYVFRSPNDGVKVLVPFNVPVTEKKLYKFIWAALAQEAENLLGVKPDATADMCRACFVSWDKDLISTHNEPLDVEMFRSAVGSDAVPTVTDECRFGERHYDVAADVPSAGEPTDKMSNTTTDRMSVATDEGRVVDDPSEYYVRLAVEYLCGQKMQYADWTKVCMALFNHLGEAGRQYWNMFLHNPNYPNETQANLDNLWESLQKYPSVKIGSLFYIAGNYGWRNVVAPQSQHYSLEDYPELISMFASKRDVPLDRSKLPKVFCEYIDIINQITDSSEGAKLTALLPVVAACIGNRIAIYNAGTRHFCNIWAVIIGPSGISRKTTVINQALKCLEAQRKSLKELSPKEKIEQSIELNKPTQARLLNLLSIDSNRLIVQTEIGAWMAEMQKSYNQGMKAELTDMFDGSDKAVAKIGIDEYISKPAFSIIGGSTEEWFMREMKEVSDQMGGFLQRHIVCFYRDIDVEKMDFSHRSCGHLDKELHAYGEMLEVFRSLKGTHYLMLGKEAVDYRNGVYAAKMRENAIKGSDPLISYTTRIYDNYFFRFCTMLFAIKNWMDIKDAIEGSAVSSFFSKREVDLETAQEAMYLCDYYFENTKPFMQELAEAGKLENEKKVVGILREFGLQEIPHHRLLSASKLTGFDFKRCIESLIERQGVICIERKGYQNRVARFYRLNPVLV